MKKILLLTVLAALSFNNSFGQGHFKLGVNAGIPVGDAEDYTTFQLGADVAYMFSVAEMVEVGPMVGYSHFFGDDITIGDVSIEVDDIQFLPVALSGRFGLTSFFVGADLGYAIGLNDGNDGGFYYRPQIGYNFGKIGVLASYAGVSKNGDNISSVNLGLQFKL